MRIGDRNNLGKSSIASVGSPSREADGEADGERIHLHSKGRVEAGPYFLRHKWLDIIEILYERAAPSSSLCLKLSIPLQFFIS